MSDSMIHHTLIQRRPLLRKMFLIGAAALTLSACGKDLIGPPEAGLIYPVRPVFPTASGEKVRWALSILRPDMAAGLNGDRIAVLQADGSMDYFAKATYPDALPTLMQHALVDGFEATGRIDAVAAEEAALHADYDLLVDIKDFSAHYGQPDGVPSVTVSISAKLATAHGRAIVSSFSTVQTVAASANSAGAAVQALQQALGTAVTQIANWALAAPMPVTQLPVTTMSPGKPAEQLLHDVTRGSERLRQKTPR